MWKSWIPNVLSLANLSFGFLAMLVISTYTHKVEDPNQIYLIAGLLIVIAAVFDYLDGPMARMLEVQSSLGEQLDSLADLTTFGIAPAFLMYHMYLDQIRFGFLPDNFKIGLIIAVFYTICAAYRLARFNVEHDTTSFKGLPSPIAGIFVALIAISFQKLNLPGWLPISIFAIVSVLMVSNLKYAKPQVSMKSHFTIPRIIFGLIVLGVAITKLNWAMVLFLILCLYIFSGLVALAINLIQKPKYNAE